MGLGLIISVAIAIVIVGGIAYLLQLAPINETFKKVGMVIIILIGIVWALKLIGGMAP